MKKIIGLFLAALIVMLIFSPALTSFATENSTVKLMASSNDPITITKKTTLPDEYDFNGALDITGGYFDIDRDYAQECGIFVKNNSETSVEYYLTVMNTYSDIYLNFVRCGSVDIPLVIAAGETQQIQLDIFTQNAERSEYTLPIYAHIVENESEYVDSMTTAFLNVPSVELNVSFLKKSNDSHTLAQVFTIKNNGSDVSDFSVKVDDALKEYVFFSPSYENYPLKRGETIEFTVSPDLYKMKTYNMTKLEGQLIATSGGMQKSTAIIFDTLGQEIVTTTIGEIVSMQMGLSANSLQSKSINGGTFTDTKKGKQCTNAGKVSVNQYVPATGKEPKISSSDNSSSNGVRLFLTSRMYGGDYVNQVETNYDYYINGKLVSKSHNSGLTELSITELPTDNIKFGATNTIVRDYDTNPGTHFVTASTEITIFYPYDTPVSYIGSPDTLPDYRPLPDFAVYSENIFNKTADMVKGVESELSINVYNKGFSDGTFNIEVSDGNQLIYQETNRILSGFSGDVISFKWVPSEDSHTIAVKLTNTTEGMPERDDSNNTASRTFSVRPREIPQITSITPDYVVEGENIVYATVSKYSDVNNVEFYVDGDLYTGEVSSSVYGGATRYWINDSELREGSHEVRVVVYYDDGNDSYQTVEATKGLSVLAPDWNQYTFSLDDSLTNKKFYVYDESRQYSRRIYNVTQNGNLYTYSMSKAEYDEPNNYLLVVIADDAVLFKSLSDESDLLRTDGKTVTIEKNDAIQINSIYLCSVDEKNITASFYNQSILTLTPGKYEFVVDMNYLGDYRNVNIVIDVSEENKIIDLSEYCTQYIFNFADEIQGTPEAIVYTFDSENRKQTIYPITQLNGTELLTLIPEDDQTTFDAATRAIVCVTTDDILYVANAKNFKHNTTVSKNKLQKYNLSAGDFTFTEIEVSCADFIASLKASTIYVTQGEYEITAYCKNLDNNELFASSYSDVHYVPEKDQNDEGSFAVKVSSAYDRYISLYATSSDKNLIAIDHYFSGDMIPAAQDIYQANFSLTRNTATYTVASQINSTQNTVVTVGSEFTGSIANSFGSSYEGYSEITLFLSGLEDKYKNKLTAFSAKDEADNLCGELLFINTKDKTDQHSVWVSMNNVASLSVILPDIDGTYNLQLIVSNSENVDTLKGISMKTLELQMFCNRSYTMDVQMHPANYAAPKLIWSSSDESVVTVDENGVITSAYEDIGTAIITAQTEDGTYVAQCTVTVHYHLYQLIRKMIVTIYRFIKETVASLIAAIG